MKLYQLSVELKMTLFCCHLVKVPNFHCSVQQWTMLVTESHWVLQCKTYKNSTSQSSLPLVLTTAPTMEIALCLETVYVKMAFMEVTVAKVNIILLFLSSPLLSSPLLSSPLLPSPPLPPLSSHLFICLSIAGTPPSEPPVFEIPYEVHGIVDEPVFIPIVAILPDRNTTDGLVVYVDNVPTQANFSRGTKEGNRWIFTPDEFGEIPFNLPPGFIGIIELEVTAVAFGARRQRSLAVYIRQSINSTEMLTVSPTMPTEVPSSVSTEITRPTTLTTATSITRETPASIDGISMYCYIIVAFCILKYAIQQLQCCTYCMIFPSCQTTLL